MKTSSELARAAEILAALAGPDALAVIQFLCELGPYGTESEHTIAQSKTLALPLDEQQIRANVNALAEVDVIHILDAATFSDPEARLVQLNEDMPDLARVVIEALYPKQAKGAVTFSKPLVDMSVVTPGYMVLVPPVTVETAPISLEIKRRFFKIKPYGRYMGREHIDLFTRAAGELINDPPALRLYCEKWNAARNTSGVPLFDFTVDLDDPEAPWNLKS